MGVNFYTYGIVAFGHASCNEIAINFMSEYSKFEFCAVEEKGTSSRRNV
jgi:hypothetical protein